MPSLKVVLHDIEQKPIFCLGDMIGKGSQSKEVVDLYLKKVPSYCKRKLGRFYFGNTDMHSVGDD